MLTLAIGADPNPRRWVSPLPPRTLGERSTHLAFRILPPALPPVLGSSWNIHPYAVLTSSPKYTLAPIALESQPFLRRGYSRRNEAAQCPQLVNHPAAVRRISCLCICSCPVPRILCTELSTSALTATC
ncbi:hypothetical protein Cob_v012395 [Colletotrichum orbiculare MAFF 240422]|uniref:Uncharacterized protein n=1 Tax=Colletotrichum orbiculare (strain 104-T / ATCC 96160 / CBS 514.97 / LARS 414 / MAFF 240422) TaxID=1213857 RepID=A0A484FCI2_COLOR|nr:hypothetical protein Cob_v012395 [Colletotrichum orbiculare MAFF 240422]